MFDLALTRLQLPLPQQREFHEGLAQILARATEVHMLSGVPEEEALAAARSAAWSFIRDMGPIDLKRAKRQKFLDAGHGGKGPPGSSSKGWY